MNRWLKMLTLGLWLAAPALALAENAPTDVTFIVTSDTHYREPDHKAGPHNDYNEFSIKEMNRIAETTWPEKLGGGKVDKPRGVLVLGDCIDDGDRTRDGRKISAEQDDLFVKDFGFDGTDGMLKYPVFEGFGNHDGPPEGQEKSGFSFQAQLKQRNKMRLDKGMITNLSDNNLHYSWDWDRVHFVQLNLYPADQQRDGIRYSPVWHNPQGALSFLKKDLAQKVGDSGRPVILMSHCGFDTDWWNKDDWKAVYDVAKPYNVVLYLYGHTGTGLHQWAPEGEPKKWDCINDGQTEKGFFVIQITDTHIRAAQRSMVGLIITSNVDHTLHRRWAGQWGWRWMLDKPMAASGNAKPVITP